MTGPDSGQRLKVLVSTSTYPTSLDSGIPRFIHDLTQALALYSDVCVLTPHSPGAAVSEKVGEVEVIRFPYFVPRRLQKLALGQGMRDNLRTSWLARLQVPMYMAALTWATRGLLKRRTFDVLNPHWLVPQGLATAIASPSSSSVPIVLTVHGGDVFLTAKLPFGKQIARYVVARSSAIFSSGSGVRTILDGLSGRPSHALLRPMGVQLEKFRECPPGPPVPELQLYPEGFLLFVGRMIEIKGLEYLVRALPTVRASHPGLGLVLIGDGPEENKIRKAVGEMGLSNAVTFLGRRPHDDIVRYLHASRVAVVPSIIDSRGETEGMPTVVVEAMATGSRVVASRIAGIPDVLTDGVNGWLCEQKNPEALADAIIEALDEEGSENIARRAWEDAKGHDWDSVAREYLDIFVKVSTR